jgi:hypothetical protein
VDPDTVSLFGAKRRIGSVVTVLSHPQLMVWDRVSA